MALNKDFALGVQALLRESCSDAAFAAQVRRLLAGQGSCGNIAGTARDR